MPENSSSAERNITDVESSGVCLRKYRSDLCGTHGAFLLCSGVA